MPHPVLLIIGEETVPAPLSQVPLVPAALRHVDALWLPPPFVHPGPQCSTKCTPEVAAICLLSFCHYSSLYFCLYVILVSQLLIMFFFLNLLIC